jgi:hypothetical protein
MMEAGRSSETSVAFYQSTRRYNSENSRLYLLPDDEIHIVTVSLPKINYENETRVSHSCEDVYIPLLGSKAVWICG